MSAETFSSALAKVEKLQATWQLLKDHLIRRHKVWNIEKIEETLDEYRIFLALAAINVPAVPCQDVDVVWHAHILHTRQYAKDCEAIKTGWFLHHTPSDGSEVMHRKLENAMKDMLQAYEFHTGYPPHAMWLDDTDVTLQSSKKRKTSPDEAVKLKTSPSAEIKLNKKCDVVNDQTKQKAAKPLPATTTKHVCFDCHCG
jgi:hypothetical protein